MIWKGVVRSTRGKKKRIQRVGELEENKGRKKDWKKNENAENEIERRRRRRRESCRFVAREPLVVIGVAQVEL